MYDDMQKLLSVAQIVMDNMTDGFLVKVEIEKYTDKSLRIRAHIASGSNIGDIKKMGDAFGDPNPKVESTDYKECLCGHCLEASFANNEERFRPDDVGIISIAMPTLVRDKY